MATSSSAPPRTTTSFVSRSTSTDSTPGTAPTSPETAALQWPQCIAGTVYVSSLMEASVHDTPRGYLGGFVQRFELARHGEPLERVELQRPDAFAGDPQPLGDRLEGERLAVPVEPVARLHPLALPLRRPLDRVAERVPAEIDGHLHLRRLLLPGEEVSEDAGVVV